MNKNLKDLKIKCPKCSEVITTIGKVLKNMETSVWTSTDMIEIWEQGKLGLLSHVHLTCYKCNKYDVTIFLKIGE